jgi:hypothetical protein
VIAYSHDTEPARAFLLKSYNDIDIFVEDRACQNMYVRLFSRMLRGRAKVTHVFPLDGRTNLIETCCADQLPRQRRRLYVMDADQDLILGKSAPKLNHFYRLKVYCSENLLLSEHAFVTLGTECSTSTSWPDMALKLSLRSLFDDAVETLLPLFVEYAVAKELGAAIETVGFPVQRLLKDPSDPSSLSKQLVRTRAAKIARELRASVPDPEYRTIRNAVVRRIARSKRDHSVYISGKTYLLPLAYLKLKKVAGMNESVDRVKVRLAQHCELSIDRGLKQAVLKS